MGFRFASKLAQRDFVAAKGEFYMKRFKFIPVLFLAAVIIFTSTPVSFAEQSLPTDTSPNILISENQQAEADESNAIDIDDIAQKPKEDDSDSVQSPKPTITSGKKLALLTATSENFINIESVTGEFAVSGAVSSSSSSDTGIATYSGGKIYGHSQGVCNVTLNMGSGDTVVYHVSVFVSYPQPKTTVVFASGDGIRLSKWGKNDNTDYVTGRALKEGEVVTIKWRAMDQNADVGTDGVMQYVSTSDGISGYLNTRYNSDRPMLPAYNNDIPVGSSMFISTGSSTTMREDMKSWTSNDTSVATISRQTNPDNGLKNQGKVNAIKEGVTLITTTMEYTTSKLDITEDFKTSGYISVYTPVSPSVSGVINKATATRLGATTSTRTEARYAPGAAVTISGSCGNYWRIADSRYIPKSDINIPVTGVTVTPTYAEVPIEGTAQFSVSVSPTQATDKTVAWSSIGIATATVNASGKVTGKKEGVVSVRATSNTGSASDSSKISVYTAISDVKGVANKNASLWHCGDGTSSNGSISKNSAVTISGQCGNYWRIGSSRYVLKTDVNIPATGIALNRNSAILYKNKSDSSSIQLNSTVTPQISTDNLTYGSSNTNVAAVSAAGKLTAIGKGAATITAKTGSKTAICKTTVYIAAASVTAPITLAVQVGTSKLNSPITINPTDASGYKKTFTSANSKIAKIDNTGKVSAAKQGTVYTKITLDHPAPSIGSMPKSVSANTFISVYAKVDSFAVRTKAADVKLYPGATTGITTNAKTMKSKGALLTVIGKCGDYYYARYRSDPGVIGFVQISKVENVYISHKTAIRGQVYAPKYSDIILLKSDKTTQFVSTSISNKDSGTVSREKKSGAYTENLKAGNDSGRATLYAVKKDLKGSKQTKAYEQHVSVITYTPLSTGNIKVDTYVYSCAEMKCYAGKLVKGTKVTVVGKCGNARYISYTSGKNTIYGYIPASNVSYVTINSFALKAGKNTNSKAVSFIGDAALNKTINSATMASGAAYATVKFAKDASVTVTSKSAAGYGVLKLETPKGGVKYRVYDPISVYTDIKNSQGYIKSYTALYIAASDVSEYSYKQRMLAANTELTILGEKGALFYVKTSQGYYGFVEKTRVVHLALSNKYGNYKLGSTKQITLKIYNESASSVKVGNATGDVSVKKGSAPSSKVGGESVVTITYDVTAKKVGTQEIKFTSNGLLPTLHFASVYEGIGASEGFTNKSGDLSRGAVSAKSKWYSEIRDTTTNTKVTIYGKCGDWMYVKYGDNYGWLPYSKVSYVKLNDYSVSLYQYHDTEIYAYLVNGTNDNGIGARSSNTKIAAVKTANDKNRKKITISADSAGNTSVYATYSFGKGTISSLNAGVTVKAIHISIPDKVMDVGELSNQGASVYTLPNAKVKFESGNSNIIQVDSATGKLRAVGKGSAIITAKYRELKMLTTLTVNEIMIYQSKRKPILDSDGKTPCDMKYADRTNAKLKDILKLPSDVIENSHTSEYSMKWLLEKLTRDENLNDVAMDMFDYFKSGEGGYFRDSTLNEICDKHQHVKQFKIDLASGFNYAIKSSNGNLENIYYGSGEKSKLLFNIIQSKPRIQFTTKNDKLDGLGILIHDTWAAEVYVDSYKQKPDGKYDAKLHIIVYDHFGLDKDDLDLGFMESLIFNEGFIAWYTLQHYDKYKGIYKPFVTTLDLYTTTKGSWK
jgi:uncharacterized protein YjdB